MTSGEAVNLRNVLVLLGIVITTAGLVYFATEFVDLISDWGRVVALVLLAVVFVALGVHFEQSGAAAVTAHTGWRWLKVNNALYVLAAVASFAAVVSFFVIDELDRIWKVAASIALGLGLIVVAAWRMERRPRA